MEIGKKVLKEFEKVLECGSDYYLNNLDVQYKIHLVDKNINIECDGSVYKVSTKCKTNTEIIEEVLIIVKDCIRRNEQLHN